MNAPNTAREVVAAGVRRIREIAVELRENRECDAIAAGAVEDLAQRLLDFLALPRDQAFTGWTRYGGQFGKGQWRKVKTGSTVHECIHDARDNLNEDAIALPSVDDPNDPNCVLPAVPELFVGWYRVPCGRWEEVCRARTEVECWRRLPDRAPAMRHRELCVVMVGENPNDSSVSHEKAEPRHGSSQSHGIGRRVATGRAPAAGP